MIPARHFESRVSVIVLNYNGASSASKCIESILAQSYPPFEIILVDNNSTDGSADAAQRQFPALRVIRNSKNLGFAEGNNVGIRESRGDLVLLVNNDVVLDHDAVSYLVRRMSPQAGLVTGAIYYAYGGEVWSYGGLFDPLTGMHWHNLQGVNGGKVLPENIEIDYAPGALLLARRSLLEKVGLLDDYFFLYGDDIDLALKAKRLGLSVEATPSAVAHHLVSQSVRKLEEEHELLGYYLMNRNMFYMYFTQLPVPYAITSTVSQMGFLLFELLLFRRPTSYLAAKTRALAHAILDLGKALRVRRRVGELGALPAKPRLKDFLSIARARAATRTYYW